MARLCFPPTFSLVQIDSFFKIVLGSLQRDCEPRSLEVKTGREVPPERGDRRLFLEYDMQSERESDAQLRLVGHNMATK